MFFSAMARYGGGVAHLVRVRVRGRGRGRGRVRVRVRGRVRGRVRVSRVWRRSLR